MDNANQSETRHVVLVAFAFGLLLGWGLFGQSATPEPELPKPGPKEAAAIERWERRAGFDTLFDFPELDSLSALVDSIEAARTDSLDAAAAAQWDGLGPFHERN